MKITKNDFCYFTTEQDLTFGEQITLDGELLIHISALDKIKEDIRDNTLLMDNPYTGETKYSITEDDVLAIINKYKDKGLKNDQQI